MKLIFTYLIFFCVFNVDSVYCQSEEILLSNRMNNNRYNIEYYAKQKEQNTRDSLYFYIDDNYKFQDKLFYRDFVDMAYYYLIKGDTIKSKNAITKTILCGIDSSMISTYFNKLDLYQKKELEKLEELSAMYKKIDQITAGLE